MYLPITTYLAYGRISQFLAAEDNANNTLYKGGSLMPRLPALLNMVRGGVEWAYAFDPTDETLNVTGPYLYALCGKYLPEAGNILGDAGGVIIIPGGGTASAWVPLEVEFLVGDPDDLISAGEVVMVLPFRGIIANTALVFKDGTKLKNGSSTVEVAYTIVYGVSSTTVTFNTPVEDGWRISVDGWRDTLA